MKPKSTPRPATHDAFLARLPADQRNALGKLRKTIKAAAPAAEECFSYGLPAFRLNGRALVAFGASAKHCSFYPMSGTTVAAHQRDLKDYDTSKGTIRFQPAKPLPAKLVRKLVKARMAENAALDVVRRRPRPAERLSEAAATVRSMQSASRHGESQTDPAVAEFFRTIDHPLKPQIETLRRTILDISPEIREGIKWNAPSFRTNDYFATMNLRATDGAHRLWLILHTGAKKKRSMKGAIADPSGILEWLADDRCLVTFTNDRELRFRLASLKTIIRAWIRRL